MIVNKNSSKSFYENSPLLQVVLPSNLSFAFIPVNIAQTNTQLKKASSFANGMSQAIIRLDASVNGSADVLEKMGKLSMAVKGFAAASIALELGFMVRDVDKKFTKLEAKMEFVAARNQVFDDQTNIKRCIRIVDAYLNKHVGVAIEDVRMI